MKHEGLKLRKSRLTNFLDKNDLLEADANKALKRFFIKTRDEFKHMKEDEIDLDDYINESPLIKFISEYDLEEGIPIYKVLNLYDKKQGRYKFFNFDLVKFQDQKYKELFRRKQAQEYDDIDNDTEEEYDI